MDFFNQMKQQTQANNNKFSFKEVGSNSNMASNMSNFNQGNSQFNGSDMRFIESNSYNDEETQRKFIESAPSTENPKQSKYLNGDFMNSKSKPNIDFQKMLANIKLPVL